MKNLVSGLFFCVFLLLIENKFFKQADKRFVLRGQLFLCCLVDQRVIINNTN